MKRLEEQRLVRAPIACCWEILTDPARAPQWVPFISAASAEGPPGLGRELSVTGSLLGISMRSAQTVDTWDEPHRYGWCADEPFPTRLRVRLREVDATTTDVTAALEAEPGGFAAVGSRLAKRTIRRQFARSADRLVALAEELA